jgi:hypothetical protein
MTVFVVSMPAVLHDLHAHVVLDGVWAFSPYRQSESLGGQYEGDASDKASQV